LTAFHRDEGGMVGEGVARIGARQHYQMGLVSGHEEHVDRVSEGVVHGIGLQHHAPGVTRGAWRRVQDLEGLPGRAAVVRPPESDHGVGGCRDVVRNAPVARMTPRACKREQLVRRGRDQTRDSPTGTTAEPRAEHGHTRRVGPEGNARIQEEHRQHCCPPWLV
jgi:hypothetical protein